MSVESLDAPARGAASRGLWPKEHGAYGQLGLPIVTSLATGTPTVASVLFAAAAVAAFVAHEPLLVWMGRRGARARREDGGRALRYGASFAASGVALGVGAMVIGGSAAAQIALLPLGLALLALVFVVKNQERTTLGELVVGGALPSAALPVAVAGGVATELALGTWAAWSLAFACATAAVRCVVGRAKSGRRSATLVAIALVATAILGVLSLRIAVVRAAFPVLLVCWMLLAVPPHPRHLRRVGWTLVASTTAMAILVVAFAR
ncbi:MAG: YwiC-like family protein [Deltaproteobacteria bacterium]|nr:YwiC-like family protein [Deltaproteobacteria bacterium]